MLQRYDISMDSKTNCLSIKEFAVLERKSRKSEHLDPAEENYSLIHEETYEVDIIRKALNNGKASLITELRFRRSDPFFIENLSYISIELYNFRYAIFKNSNALVFHIFFKNVRVAHGR